ncbi:hypothetical protein WDW86_18370 [Bdellovibrionota bacterium FG-2]
MRFNIVYVMLTVLIAGSAAGAAEDTSQQTQAEAKEITRGYLRDEKVAVKPQLGVVAFNEPSTNNTRSRFATGVTAEMNAVPFVDKTMAAWYLGPSTGLIFSHLGADTSNFVGSNQEAGSQGQPSANLLIIPTNLKVGYAFTDYYRLAAHGGGNIVYRSVGSSILLDKSDVTSDTQWKYYPNVGADLDVAISPNLALSVRPDWTLTPDDKIFMGTVALSVNFS